VAFESSKVKERELFVLPNFVVKGQEKEWDGKLGEWMEAGREGANEIKIRLLGELSKTRYDLGDGITRCTRFGQDLSS